MPAYNYATEHDKKISDIIRQESLTGILETPQVNWTGAKTFVEKTLSVTGYKAHTRDMGWNQGTIQDSLIPYTLSFDRDIQFFADKADVDETNEALTAGNVTNAFMRQQVIPELDAYRFSKISSKAIELNQATNESVTMIDIYPKLKAALLPIRKYGASNIICYMSSEAMDALEQSDHFGRNLSTEKISNIETRVASLDGMRLIEVWDDARFKTEFDFTEGFTPTSTAKSINFMLVAKPSIIAKAKINSIYLWPPGTHQQGDGWLYQNRLYHDLFIKELAKDGIYVSTRA